VDSILEVKIQLGMRRFYFMVVLSLLVMILLPGYSLAQCPEIAIANTQSLDASEAKVIQVFDAFDSEIDVSDFKVNIFNEETGNYLIAESNNFPTFGTDDIEYNKVGNKIQLLDIPVDVNLSKCVVIFMGAGCPVKKVAVTIR
jgi:hypothetical protein